VNHEVQPAEPDVSDNPKRRWYQFSLLTMLVVLTLLCVFVGGRIEYLRRSAAFHGREVKILVSRLRELTEPNPAVGGTRMAKDGTNLDDLTRLAAELTYHQKMQRRYSAAVYRPWTLVNDDRLQEMPREKDDPFR
jgi:hypothetical protein